MMAEGNAGAPFRHALDWNNPDFYDEVKLDIELRRVFDICHGCRRCFNLCDSFPRLFDLIDASPSGELDEVKSADFKPVVDACTLCDMCFMSKCPYVPPHAFNLDFPHLMLRYRAAELRRDGPEFVATALANTDRNGKLGGAVAPLANWATKRSNRLTRPMIEKLVDIDQRADLPRFVGETFLRKAKRKPPQLNRDAPSFGRKVALFATCFVNYHNTAIGEATLNVLAKNGVQTISVYPMCCGMPQLEQGDIRSVAARAATIARSLLTYVEEGFDIVAPVPSCALMMKFEWPLILPNDSIIARVSGATHDLSDYMVGLAKTLGLAPGLENRPGLGTSLHIACHARAQNIGLKAAEMLRLIPGIELNIIERCSGHGGSWGVRHENFDTALKVGKPVARAAASHKQPCVASECPLAAMHIVQGVEFLTEASPATQLPKAVHPIEILAAAYGFATSLERPSA